MSIMSKFDLSGPLLKVERADHHIDQLEELLRRYVMDNRKRFSRQHQERAFRLRRRSNPFFAEAPRHTPTVLGDAIHNLRASLDHAYCILIEANGHTLTNRSSFPFGENLSKIEDIINKSINLGNGPAYVVRDFIATDVQPYPGGKHNLWDLHQLDIVDKHKQILPMGSHAFISDLKFIDPASGGVSGEMKDCTFANIGTLDSNDMAVIKDDIRDAFDVTFGKDQPLEGRPILASLKALRADTAMVLRKFSEFL